MTTLANHDWQAAQALILRLNRVDNTSDLVGVATTGLQKLVGCDRVSYNELHTEGAAISIVTWPVPKRWRQMEEIYALHSADHPALDPAHHIPLNEVIVPSSPRYATRWFRSELYNEYFRPLGIQHQIGTTIGRSERCRICFGFNRAGKDFSERDVALVAMLSPHLCQAWHNVTAWQAAGSARAPGVDTTAVVVAGSRDGSMHALTPTAARLLHRYFPDSKSPTRLPDRLRRWVRAHTDTAPGRAPLPPLVVPASDGRLSVRIAPVREGDTVLFLEHVSLEAKVRHHCFENLSPRENEVVSWLVDGKRNQEIAIILGISPRTVEKHLESVFAKLGVETRAALVRLAFDHAHGRPI